MGHAHPVKYPLWYIFPLGKKCTLNGENLFCLSVKD